MSTKYVLIPQDFYLGLTAKQNKPNKDVEQNLLLEQNLIQKAKQLRKNDEKNINFNQEKHRYLKLKKKHDDKPVKVELANQNAQVVLKKRPKTSRGHPI